MMKKRMVALFLALCMVYSVVGMRTPAAAAAYDYTLELGVPMELTPTALNEEFYFAFVPDEDGVYLFWNESDGNLLTWLYRNTKSERCYTQQVNGGKNYFPFKLEAGVTYYYYISNHTYSSLPPFTVMITKSTIADVQADPVYLYEESSGSVYWTVDSETGVRTRKFKYNWSDRVNYTVTLEDGTTVRSEDGKFTLDDYTFKPYFYVNNSDSGQWLPGNTYEGRLNIHATQYTVPITILESPVESVSFNPIMIPENTNGSWTQGYSSDTGSYKYYSYNWYKQLSYTVTYKDGTVAHYTGPEFYYEGNKCNVAYVDPQSKSNAFQKGCGYDIEVSVMGVISKVRVMITGSEDAMYESMEVCDGQAMLKEYRDDSQVLQLPAERNGYTITKIDGIGVALDYAQELIIPDCVVEIAPDALNRENMPLKKLVLGENVSGFTASMISQALELEEILVSEDNPYYRSIDGALYNKTGTELIAYPAAKEGIYTVPAGVQNIDALFVTYTGQEIRPCAELQSVVIEDGVIYNSEKTKVLGCYASKTGSYTMPDSVVEMVPGTFRGRPLEQVTLSRNLKEIGAEAFRDCASLRSITMPAALTTVGADAFAGCDALCAVDVADVAAWCRVDFAGKTSNPLHFAQSLCVEGVPVSELVLPATFQGEIKAYAFINSSITAVTLPEGVTAIGAYAFAFTALESVTLPDSLSTVGDYGFFACSRMHTLEIGQGLTTIGNSAFSITDIRNLVIPENVTSVGESAFQCSGLQQLVVESDTVSIRSSAFGYCPLQTVELGNLSELTTGSFTGAGASFLKLSPAMTTIQNNHFGNMNNLSVVVIPATVTSVGANAFRNKFQHVLYTGTEEQWASISGSVDLTETGVVHFGATGEEITVSETCSQMCYHCAICDQTIYADKSIASHQYENEQCTVCGFSDVWEYEENGLCGEMQIIAYHGGQAHVTVPSYLEGYPVTTICDNAFSGNTAIKSVTIPDTVEHIGAGAFQNCANLRQIRLPASMRSLGSNAFDSCRSLMRINLPAGLSTIYESTFSCCYNLQEVEILAGVTLIGSEAFSSCYALERVSIPDSVSWIGTQAFYRCISLQEVMLPAGLNTLGSEVFYGCEKLQKVIMDGTLTTIPDRAFYDCGALNEINIPESVTTIGDSAFRSAGLTKLTLPEGLVTIYSSAFSNNPLQSIQIPDSVKTIEEYAFYNCSGMRVLKLPKGTQTLNSFAFCNCRELRWVEIPEGVVTIEDRVFLGCGNVRSVSLPSTIQSIGYMAFCDMGYLQELTIPASVTSLGDASFGYARNLKTIHFLGDAPTISNTAFKSVIATCYYPANNATWTDSKKLNYGGTLTWETLYTEPNLQGKSFSLSFDDEIKVNFYFTLSGKSDSTRYGMLVFDTHPGTPDISTASEVHSNCAYSAESGLYMGQTNGIAAKNLGDTLYYAAYTTRSDGTYVYSDIYTYSPTQYAASRLEKSSDANLKALCVAMLNYGAAAQQYFGYKTDDLMNAGLTDAQQALAAAYDKTLFAGAVAADESKLGAFTKTETGFSKKNVSVSFEGAFAINYYFTPDTTVNGDITFYYWTPEAYAQADTLTAENASGTAAMVAGADGVCWAQIDGIAAKNLDKTYYVAAVYTDEAGNLCCSGVISYALSKYCISKAVDGNEMCALASAAAMYGYYAKLYFAT